METGKEFTRLLNNLLRENQQYDTELKNFLDYLKHKKTPQLGKLRRKRKYI